ncbi:Hypothetical protein GSB_152074 [Giardia duodenalis]|uniref:DNA2/NAM7 helicase-like C-terminal domain-containing protein n=1 Tax=Giardia intestinalis TaxID=5741 RepID=V6U0S6_GIAIN|nr:Hypothetical protein GSB_152074 [Giardia intestinalis]
MDLIRAALQFTTTSSSLSEFCEILKTLFVCLAVEDPSSYSFDDVSYFIIDPADQSNLALVSDYYWKQINKQYNNNPASLLLFNFGAKGAPASINRYLKDQLLLSDFIVYFSVNDIDLMLLNYMCGLTTFYGNNLNSAKELALVTYVTSKLLFINGCVNGKFDDIANNRFDGEIVFLLIDAFNILYPWLRERAFIFEPVITLLGEVFLYAFGCTKNKHEHEDMQTLFSRLLQEQERSSALSVPLIDLCLEIIVSSSTKDTIVNMPTEKHLPVLNRDTRMLLASCRLLLCILSVQGPDDENQAINYIEHRIRELCPTYRDRPTCFPCFVSVVLELAHAINPVTIIAQELVYFLHELVASLILCLNYGPMLVQFCTRVPQKEATDVSRLIVLISETDNAENKLLSAVRKILRDIFQNLILGDVLSRYANGTFLLQSNLLPLKTTLGYFWMQQYHYLLTIYSDVVFDVQRSSKKGPAVASNFIMMRDDNEIHGFSNKFKIPVKWSLIADNADYDERDQLTTWPIMYQYNHSTGRIEAIYVPDECKIYADNYPLKYHKFKDLKAKYSKTPPAHSELPKCIIQMSIADSPYGTAHLLSQHLQENESTKKLYFYWTHPSIAQHIGVVYNLSRRCAINIFERKTDNFSSFMMLCLSRFDAIQYPYRSFDGYGYATVSSQPFSYIWDVLSEICTKICKDARFITVIGELDLIHEKILSENMIVFRGREPRNNRMVKLIFRNPMLSVHMKRTLYPKEFTRKTLRPSQFKALVYAALSPLTLILGSPGSGKSTTLAHISKMFLLEKNANSKWIPVLDNRGNERNRPKWNLFKDVFFSSIKTFKSVTEMILAEDPGVQLFITAHSNNAADQLTRYILEMDGWDKTTLPFIFRSGNQSKDPFIVQFMISYYLFKIAEELGVDLATEGQPYSLATGSLIDHFSYISERLRRFLSSSSHSILRRLRPKQIDNLKKLVADYSCMANWLINHATIIVGTTIGLQSRITNISDDVAPDNPSQPSTNSVRRYLIIEEAARLSEHEFASFLVASFEKIILLGDILQLPPLIQDQTLASTSALDWSIFHRICYASQVNIPIVTLEEQARSTPEIADLYRSLYESSLPKYCAIKGGLRDIPGVKFDSFVDQAILERFRGRCFYIPEEQLHNYTTTREQIASWLAHLSKIALNNEEEEVQTSFIRKVQKRYTPEESNKEEIDVILHCLYNLLDQVVKMVSSGTHLGRLSYNKSTSQYELSFSVALLSLYKCQTDLLIADKLIAKIIRRFAKLDLKTINNKKVSLEAKVFISTSDGFQGCEADITFLSITARKPRDFVENIQRSLVAVSRARRLLVCVGIANVCKNEIWQAVVRCPLPNFSCNRTHKPKIVIHSNK